MIEAPRTSQTSGDAMTAERYELNYVVPRGQHSELVRYFDRALSAAPPYLVTTVYFDTPTRRLLSAARSDAHDNVKLRAREYVDLPSRQTSESGSACVWLELKRRNGTRTQKHRVRLAQSTLATWLRERVAPAPEQYSGRETDARVLADYLASESEALTPAYVASYRRRSWQADDGRLRLTLDEDLAFFAPSPELLQRPSPLSEQLEQPSGREPFALLEVKYRARALPAWLAARLQLLGLAPSLYSKFVKAAAAVTGAP